MEEHKLRRGNHEDETPNSPQPQNNSGLKARKLKYFIPFILILIGGALFRSVFPFAQTIVAIGLTIIFVLSYGLSYIGASTKRKFIKFITTFINILLMLFFIVIGIFSMQFRIGLSQVSTPESEVEVKADQVNVNKNSFNVLVSGTDTRTDEIDTPSRSDVIMVATINPKENQVLFTSLPRDTYYPLTCTGEYDKLTHASAKSMDCLVTTVEEILNININYYIKANFYTVINMIDAVGGIDVEVDQAFYGQDENDVKNAYYFSPGMTHMDGSMALSYARERHSFSDGDYTRARHQQQVMNAVIQKVMLNPTKISSLISISTNSVRTNMTSGELMDLLNSFTSFESEGYVVSGSSTTVNIPSEDLYGTSVQILNDSSIATATAKINEYLDK